MNLHDPLWPRGHAAANDSGPSNASYNAKTRGQGNDTALSADAQAIISALASSGPHLFTFKQYWIVSVSVVVATILFPILIGPIFRSIFRQFQKNKAFLIPAFVFCVIGADVASISTGFGPGFLVIAPLLGIVASIGLLWSSWYCRHDSTSVLRRRDGHRRNPATSLHSFYASKYRSVSSTDALAVQKSKESEGKLRLLTERSKER